MRLRTSLGRSAVLMAIFLAIFCSLASPSASAAPVFGTTGDGLETGINAAKVGISGVSKKDPRDFILNILLTVLSFVNLIGVVVVVIAGLYLIFSNGNEEQKDKAKKILLYLIIGLLLLFFARVIVAFFTQTINETI